MKYIKTFENYNIGVPEVGDWVICNPIFSSSVDGLVDFIKSNIGKIIEYVTETDDVIEHYKVEYNNYIKDRGFTRAIVIEEIKYWSKNKEELEVISQANKFNI